MVVQFLKNISLSHLSPTTHISSIPSTPSWCIHAQNTVITLEMICNTGKPPSPLLKSFNQCTGKYSTQGTGFNDSSWGEQTHGLVKLIVHKLWPESYDKVIAGATEFDKKTHISVHTKDIINLTNDKPLEEFAMVVDLPSDEDDNKLVIAINEPENVYRDEDRYKDAYSSDDVAVCGIEEEGAQSDWYS